MVTTKSDPIPQVASTRSHVSEAAFALGQLKAMAQSASRLPSDVDLCEELEKRITAVLNFAVTVIERRKVILFRQNRGTLDESMATVTEVKSFPELLELIATLYPSLIPDNFSYLDVAFDHQGHDERTGWDTYNVLLRFRDGKRFPIGQSNGILTEAG